ncbi:MAG TPA: hypothetical protein VNN79_21380 [Actinomycetota bacterium]|nr:hypothetical protein [Actinomycetota bacterium]
MTRRRAEVLAWSLWGLVVATMIGVGVVQTLSGGVSSLDERIVILPFLLFATVGAIVASRRSENRLGWLYLAIGLVAAFTGIADIIEPAHLPAHGPLRVALVTLYALANDGWYPTLGLLATFSVLWFPDGRPPTPRWRKVGWMAIAGIVLMTVGASLVPGRLNGPGTPINPLGIRGATAVLGVVQAVGGALFLGSILLSWASFVVRFRRSRGVERQQLRWFLVGASVLGAQIVFSIVLNPPSNWPFALGSSAVPIAAGIAITRYHLYDLDRLLSRAVAYVAVSALLITVYAGIVVGIGALTGRTDSPILIAGATLLVAALVRPVLRRVKGAIDRRFYRRRYDAQRALEAFAASLRDEIALEQVRGRLLATVRETMQPAGATLWLRGGER